MSLFTNYFLFLTAGIYEEEIMPKVKNRETKNEIIKPKKELRPVLKKKKEEFENLGWVFRQGADEMWSATKTADGNEVYFGDHRYLSALLKQIEGEETGIHRPGKYGAE